MAYRSRLKAAALELLLFVTLPVWLPLFSMFFALRTFGAKTWEVLECFPGAFRVMADGFRALGEVTRDTLRRAVRSLREVGDALCAMGRTVSEYFRVNIVGRLVGLVALFMVPFIAVYVLLEALRDQHAPDWGAVAEVAGDAFFGFLTGRED